MIKLKEFREAKGWTQRQTAMKAGLAPTTYHKGKKITRSWMIWERVSWANFVGKKVDKKLLKSPTIN